MIGKFLVVVIGIVAVIGAAFLAESLWGIGIYAGVVLGYAFGLLMGIWMTDAG